MSINELDTKAATYFDILAQIEALTAEAEAIKDALKGVMVERGVSPFRASAYSGNAFPAP